MSLKEEQERWERMNEFNQTRICTGLVVYASLVTMKIIVSEMKSHVVKRVFNPFLFTGLFASSYYTISYYRDFESNERAWISTPRSIILKSLRGQTD
jgi:hypothetical protein